MPVPLSPAGYCNPPGAHLQFCQVCVRSMSRPQERSDGRLSSRKLSNFAQTYRADRHTISAALERKSVGPPEAKGLATTLSKPSEVI